MILLMCGRHLPADAALQQSHFAALQQQRYDLVTERGLLGSKWQGVGVWIDHNRRIRK